MQVRKTEFHRFANGETVFVIPVYQRNYDWNKENCKQLFFDILEDMYMRKGNEQKEMEGHFIGTICFKVEGKYNHVIVDGQQRLTTLMILLKALYDVTEDDFLKRKIKTKFLVNEFAQNEVKIKLKPIKRDEGSYNKLITTEIIVVNDLDETERKSNVFKNYTYLRELVEDKLKKEDFVLFLEALEQLEIVELSLDHENPQVIFESLNSTGLDLTNTDLLRNYLLMSLDYKTQERMYNEYWAKIEEMLGTDKIEKFMLYYLLLKLKTHNITINGKKGQLSTSTLYYAFKKYVPNIHNGSIEQIEKIFKELLHYAKYYQWFIFDDDAEPTEELRKYYYELFYCLEQSDAAIPIMYLNDHLTKGIIDRNTYKQVLTAMISYATRSVVCKRTGFSRVSALWVQRIDEELKTNTKLKRELNAKQYGEYIAMWWRVLTSGKGGASFPKDNEFQTALENNELYYTLKSKRCKYLLLKIEQNNNRKECLTYKNGTIEHIMPRTLSTDWKAYLNSKRDLMNYEKYVNTLGNLTLTGYNPEMGNDIFGVKCLCYSKSNYTITREIAKYDNWTSQEIEMRAKKLSAIALKIWSLPSEYNKSHSVDTGITYNFKTDLNLFTGTKPDVFSLLGEEKQVSSWRDIIVFVCKTLYDLDNQLFLKLLTTKKFYGRNQYLYTEKPETGKVDLINDAPKYYIYTNNSTEASLHFIKELLEYYDKELDMNFINETWFTLRRI